MCCAGQADGEKSALKIKTADFGGLKRGDNRIRTDDPLIANQMLYQLSYIPKYAVIIQYIKKNFNL